MFDFINQIAISTTAAMGIYFVAGLVLFYDMKRIRWYALSVAWVALGTFDRGFLIETAMLGFTYMLVESIFKMYSENMNARAAAARVQQEKEK